MVSSTSENNVLYPRTDGMIERLRLLQSLTAVFDHKLTIICAPPGYGKTTLTGQFVQQSRRPFAWHTVDERERDLPNLLAHTLTTLERIAPGIQKLGSYPAIPRVNSLPLSRIICVRTSSMNFSTFWMMFIT